MKAPAKPQEEPLYPYDKVPPTQRGRPALPTAPQHPPTRLTQPALPEGQPFSGLDNALQGEGTVGHSAAPLPLVSTFWGALKYGKGRYQDLGPTWLREQVGWAWPGAVSPNPALGAVEASRLVGGGRLAGDNPRLGCSSHCEAAKTQVRESYRPALSLGHGLRPWAWVTVKQSRTATGGSAPSPGWGKLVEGS